MLDEVVGTENPLKVKGVGCENLKTGAITEMPADGVFIAIGHAPASELFAGQLEMKPSGYIDDRPALDRDLDAGRLRRRRRHRRRLPPGRHRRRAWAAWPRSKPSASWPRRAKRSRGWRPNDGMTSQ